MNNYTELSQKTMNQALSETLTASDACDWLLSNVSFRTLPEKLKRFYKGSEDDY